jgi:hypothetical protein
VSLVYKVVSQQEWAAAEREGVFLGSAIDSRDGYIHLSSDEQVEQTVALYFRRPRRSRSPGAGSRTIWRGAQMGAVARRRVVSASLRELAAG